MGNPGGISFLLPSKRVIRVEFHFCCRQKRVILGGIQKKTPVKTTNPGELFVLTGV
jgi:hypothetical protein